MRAGLSFAFVALVLGSCAQERALLVDDALLSEVSPEQLAIVKEANTSRNDAAIALASARRNTAWAQGQVDLARSGLKAKRAAVEKAKLGTVVAERDGTTSELERAKIEHAQAVTVADAGREELSLRKREFEHAKLAERTAREEDRLAAARKELAKARAVCELDRVAAKKVPVKDFEKQVGFHKTEVALATIRAEAAKEKVEEARLEYEAAAQRANNR